MAIQQTSFYSDEELRSLGFKSLGSNVHISRNAKIYGASGITICDYVRIDDFCILTREIKLGANIHISSNVAPIGAMGIELEEYKGILCHEKFVGSSRTAWGQIPLLVSRFVQERRTVA